MITHHSPDSPHAQAQPVAICGRSVASSRDDRELPVLSEWRTEGRDLIAVRRSEFDRLLAAAEELVGQGRYAEAIASIQVAANYAVLWHTGQFASSRLEQAIRRVGQAGLQGQVEWKIAPGRTSSLNILHIGTEFYGIGGHARMVANWISSDLENVHSVALTGQYCPVPADVRQAVAASGGRLEQINIWPGGMLGWARRLQRLIATADLVVLHIHNMDVVPLLALSGLEDRPSCLLVNHGDHQFWLGASIADLVVSTRRSGFQLCIDRRGVEPRRSVLLPLCLKPRTRINSRAAAKKLLRIPESSIVVLTVARAVKFRDIGGENFVEALAPVLIANPDIHLVIVGPGRVDSWAEHINRAQNRIHVLPETPDTQIYFDAADIYLDSFPFVSLTSLLEAGLHGLPLVTRSAFGPDCAVMAADSLGLDGVLVRTDSLGELRDTILELSRNAAGRAELGEQTRNQILTTNVGEHWRQRVHELYRKALRVDRNIGALRRGRAMSDLDVFIPFVFDDRSCELSGSGSSRSAWATELVLKSAPFRWRMRKLSYLLSRNELRGSLPRAMIPAWVSASVRKHCGITRR